MRSVIRQAAKGDIEEIVALLVEMHAEGVEHTLSLQKLRTTVASVVGNGRALLAVKGTTAAIGTMGLSLSEPWYSDQPCLIDRWWYVRPEGRSSKAARQLVEAARRMASDESVPFYMGLSTVIETERKDAFLRRICGARLIGGTYRL